MSAHAFVAGQKVLLRPWWSDGTLIEAVVLERYAVGAVYYRVRPLGRDCALVPADRVIGPLGLSAAVR